MGREEAKGDALLKPKCFEGVAGKGKLCCFVF